MLVERCFAEDLMGEIAARSLDQGLMSILVQWSRPGAPQVPHPDIGATVVVRGARSWVELERGEVATGSFALIGVRASAGRLTTDFSADWCAGGGGPAGRHQIEMRAKTRRLSIPR